MSPRRQRAAVVFDLESPDAPMPLGAYISTDEEAVIYRSPTGEVRSAPADCVGVREVDVYAPEPEPELLSAQALATINVENDEPEPIGGAVATFDQVAALQVAIDVLRAIEGTAGARSWDAPSSVYDREPRGFDLGRVAEACDRARWEIENALTTLDVLAHDRAAKALDIAREQQRAGGDDA